MERGSNKKTGEPKFIIALVVLYAVFYVLLLVSQQIETSNWMYSENYVEGWFNADFNGSNFRHTELPFITPDKEGSGYVRGEIELKGLVKPEVELIVEKEVLGFYVNGQPTTVPTEKINVNGYPREKLVFDSSVLKPGLNTIALELIGDDYRLVSVKTLKPSITDSPLLLVFMALPLLLFINLKKEHLDSRKIMLLVFIVVTLVFAKAVFFDFNYWGNADWDMKEAFEGIARESIVRYHQLPLWNPYSHDGQPLAGDPQSMMFSLLNPLVLVFGAIAGMKLKLIAWYVIGLTGMYFLAKRYKISTYGCYLASFVFMLSSSYSLHMSEGHMQPAAIPLAPWIFLLYLNGLEDKKQALLGGLVMAFIAFEGSMYTLLRTALFLTLYTGLVIAKKHLEGVKDKKKLLNPLITLMIVGLVCASVSAVKTLPSIELNQKYPRLTSEIDPFLDTYRGFKVEYLTHAFIGRPQSHFVDKIDSSIWYEYGTYIGPIALLLALLGMLLNWRKNWPLIVIIILGVLLSVGTSQESMPLWDLLHKLPLFSSMRYPSRFILLALIPLSIFAGQGLKWIEERKGLLAGALTVLVLYNLVLVSSPVYDDMFNIAPRTGFETRFTQVAPDVDKTLIHSETYTHFLRNQGQLNYGSLSYMAGAKPAGKAVTESGYRGEVYLDSGEGTAVFESFSPNRMVVKVEANRADTLFVNQNYDKGWKAFDYEVVNKKNLIAVDVTPGDHRIVLYYSSTSFKVGLIITLLTLVLVWKFCMFEGKKFNLKKFTGKLLEDRILVYVLIILLVSTYGVDFIQSSGLYSENEVALNGQEYMIPEALSEGQWSGFNMKHQVGIRNGEKGWASSTGKAGYIARGPYIELNSGRYEAIFKLKIEADTLENENKIVRIDVASDGLIIEYKELYASDFKSSEVTQEFKLPFTLKRPTNNVEFRVYVNEYPSKVILEEISFTMT